MTPWYRRLAAARRRTGLTQAEVARRAGIDRSTYAHYEIGRRKPEPEVAVLLARVLGSTVELLFGGASPRAKSRRARRPRKATARPATSGGRV